MLKQRSQLFNVLNVFADLLVVSAAWVLAYWLRFDLELIPVEKGIPPFANYFQMLLFIWLIWAFVFQQMGLYRPMRGVSRLYELWQVVKGTSLSMLLLIAAVYLFKEKSVPFSRLVFLYFWLLSTSFVLIERAVLRSLLREVRRRGYNLRYMLVVGAGRIAADIAERLREHQELGVQVVGCLAKTTEQKRGPGGIPIVGTYADLPLVLEQMDIDKVMVALPLEDNHLLPGIMSEIGDSLLDVKIVPDLYQFVTLGGSIEEFDGLPVISLQSSPLEGVNSMLKRVLDLLIASFALLILSPLLLLIALLVKLSSPGPVLYRQERVSVDGSCFTIFKFRTMRSDAEVDGPGWTRKNDQRVTAVGSVLRSLSLDELPQLFNVLLGDMSIVGPRPERPVYIEEFRRRVPRYMLRHKVPAGITGWAQVHGWRGDTSIGKRIEFDLYYIENWSLFLDLKILFLTLFRGFRNKNAY